MPDPSAESPAPAADGAVARDRAAQALRRLGHAVVGHEADPALLQRIADLAGQAAAEVEAGTARQRPVQAIKRRLWESPPADGSAMSHFPECVVSGTANPMGIAMRVHRDGEEAVADLELGPAFEGAPRRAHGGVIAAVFDDVMGYVLVLRRVPAFTGQLTVNYRAPVPVGQRMRVRARLRRRDGRKLHMAAEMHASDVPVGAPVCNAEGLFIAIPPERLGLHLR